MSLGRKRTPNFLVRKVSRGGNFGSFTQSGRSSILGSRAPEAFRRSPEVMGHCIMKLRRRVSWTTGWSISFLLTALAMGQATRDTPTFKRLKIALDAIPAIDTHDHLGPFDRLPGLVETERGRGMNLAGLWRNSYFPGVHHLTPWKPGMPFDDWWSKAKSDFSSARATSVYRYQLPAFSDLYKVDFDRISDAEARRLNDEIFLCHGGFPWVGETGIILMRHSSHVWLDSVWMPTLSYSTSKRAFHEWLDVMPSSRIMWGGDANHAEGIYGATEMTRRCLAEVLAERVDRGDLREEHALAIGRQILRDNALALFPAAQGPALETQGCNDEAASAPWPRRAQNPMNATDFDADAGKGAVGAEPISSESLARSLPG